MKPLNLEETRLKEEMKSRCLNKGKYIDENAKAKFNMLCHLEDFEIEYWNLQQENQKYKEVIDKAIDKLNSFIECCKAEKIESGSDYLHHQYWDMFERFNKQVKQILEDKEV